MQIINSVPAIVKKKFSTTVYIFRFFFVENKEKMSSPPVDPRRQEKIRPYKPSQNNGQSTSGGEDFICDYMNILGMVFSMCGLMMKLKWCGKLKYYTVAYHKAVEMTIFLFSLFTAWLALYCSCISFANSRASDDAKQVR